MLQCYMLAETDCTLFKHEDALNHENRKVVEYKLIMTKSTLIFGSLS